MATSVLRKCSIDECNKAVKAREWCTLHYQRWYNNGGHPARYEKNAGKLCLDGCGRPAYTKGRCASHYSMAVDRTNPNQKRGRRQRDYQRHSDAYKQRATTWRQANPDKVRIINLNAFSRRKHQAQGTLTNDEWQTILASTEHRCAYCWKPVAVLEADHVMPLSRGGHTTADNILPACRSCNASKSGYLLEEWLTGYNHAYN